MGILVAVWKGFQSLTLRRRWNFLVTSLRLRRGLFVRFWTYITSSFSTLEMIVIIRLIPTVLSRGQGTIAITASPRIIFFSVTLHTLTFSSNAFAW